MNIARLSIRRPTFITAIVAVMLIVGYIFMNRMSVDMFPDVNFPFVAVTTVYSGAGPQEVETLISKKLEEQFSAISGLKHVTSINQDGVSIVYGEFTLETDPKYAEQQVKDKISQIRNQLPDDIEEPVVQRFDPADQPIGMVTLTADLPPAKLYDLADTTIKNGMQQVANVSKVDIIGGTKREIHVDLDRNKLKDYETSLTGVAGHVGANSQNIPIGKISLGAKELAFRSLGEFRSLDQIRNVIVSFFGSDVPITVDRVGRVVDTTEEVKTLGYLDGKSALVLNVYKQSGANTVRVADELKKRIDKLNDSLKSTGGAPKLLLVQDGARPIRNNLQDVKQTIFEGIILAIIVVYLFLGNIRSTFITVIALPNSLIGAFIFMGLAGFSINMLSLMALSLAVGLLIDDAIVVRENIFRHIENGETPVVAAEKGTNEVALAVVATTLTVIAVFLPVGFLQGMIGQFFKEFGLTVVFAMGISLFDAMTTAPMLSAYMIGQAHSDKKTETPLAKIVHAPAVWFNVFYDKIERLYEKSIRFTLRHKALVLAGSVVIFIGSLALTKGIPKTFMPTNEHGEFYVNLEAQPGTSLQQMNTYAENIRQQVQKEKDVALVLTTVGNANGESNTASLYVKMVDYKVRSRSTSDLKDATRRMLEPYAKLLSPKVNDPSMGGGEEQPFQLLLKGEDLGQLAALTNELLPQISKIPGLVDVNSNYRPGKPEFQVKMDPRKMERFGVQSITAGSELRGMVDGSVPAKYRENGMEYDIRVRLQDSQRDLSSDFNALYVPNVNNQLVKLHNLADPVQTTGPSKIYRRDRGRYIMISGNLGQKGAIGDITTAAAKVLKNTEIPEGITYEFVGSSEDMVDLFKNMVIAMVLSVIFIYLVLASLYESMIIPLTIMIALPLAIVGGLVALFLFGESINMFTMIGFIMLLGLVTKNSILLVDHAQKQLRLGLDHDAAVIKAGVTRFRPILMTSFALIAGMLPLAMGLSESGKFRQSMGIAIIGGLISSTLLTLVVIPAIFESMDRLRLWTRRLVGRPPQRIIDQTED